jgi:hypothetical protein
MPTAWNNLGEVPIPDTASTTRRKYVVPSLSRYGTLADLTRTHNDGGEPDGLNTCGEESKNACHTRVG